VRGFVIPALLCHCIFRSWTKRTPEPNRFYLLDRRQVAGAVPNAFLKARENAASEL
jgi:hypothetical protein